MNKPKSEMVIVLSLMAVTLTGCNLTVKTTPGGSVVSTDGYIQCGSIEGACSRNYNESSDASLSAIPNEGYEFVGWSGNCKGTGNCSVSMNLPRNVSATFVLAGETPLNSLSFASSNFRKCVLAHAYDQGWTSVVEMTNLTCQGGDAEPFNIEGPPINSIEGIQNLTQLQSVRFERGDCIVAGGVPLCSDPFKFTTLEPMSSLTQLQSLVTATATDISELTPIAEHESLTNLELTNTNITELPDLSGMTQLRNLSLLSHNISVFDDAVLPASLESLSIEIDSASDLSWMSGQSFPNLITLNIGEIRSTWGNLISLNGIESASLPLLESLQVIGHQLADASALGAADLPSLQDLNLSSNSLTNLAGWNSMELPSVTSLDLSQNDLVDVRGINSSTLPALAELSLSNSALETISVENMDGHSGLELLTLTRSEALITVPGLTYDRFTGLRRIYMTWTGVNDLTPLYSFADSPVLEVMSIHTGSGVYPEEQREMMCSLFGQWRLGGLACP